MAAVPRVRPRLRTTWFVFPASGLEDVRRPAGHVDDVEVVVREHPDRAIPGEPM